MIVCDSKKNIKMNKYNIVSIFFRFGFGHVSILMWFLNMIFHKIQMYPTHIVVVMEACVECTSSNTNEVESQGKYIHEKIIDDEWNSLYLLKVIWFMYMQNVAIRICGKMNTLFFQSSSWNPS